jgi:ABC-2 type transport system permease protein
MRNAWTIANREYKHYFNSSIAYVVAFLILIAIGFVFANQIDYFIRNSFQSFGSAPEVTSITGVFAYLLVLSVPALTMRLISDENKMGTIELLLTAPVRDWELVLGKWLGGFLFIITVLGITLIFPLIMNSMVVPGIDQSLMVSAYLGTILIAAAYLGLGVGISALFKSQIAAFFMSLITFIVLSWLLGIPAALIPNAAGFFNYLDMQAHFSAFNSGAFYVSDIVYFVSLTVFGLFIGATALEMRRWR